MRRLIDESYRLRRLARHLGWRPSTLRAEAPGRPVGAKFELTHACNLRCGFCYTDSPRHTLSRTPDLPDHAWLSLADQATDLGVIEVVLSGGEPFLRRALVLEMVERLGNGGIGVTLNTNGWFVDDEIANRLAAAEDPLVDISVDGATPALHDGSRGVPGSWRRAVAAVSRLLDRGVRVQVVHVVTPANEDAFPELLEQMWTLGVSSVRVTPVVEIGAAARGGRWAVSRTRLRRAIKRFGQTHPGMRIVLQGGNAGVLALHEETAPAALLVRPSGAVLADSLHPFAFGNAVRDGLEVCWERIVSRWDDPRITAWAASLGSSHDIPGSGAVPYLDDEVAVAGDDEEEPYPANPSAPPRYVDASVPRPARPKDDTGDDRENLARARRFVRDLVMARRYRRGPVRLGGGPGDHYARSATDGTVSRLNGTAALVAGVLDGGTVGDAVEALAGRYPGTERARVEGDVLATARTLASRDIVVPAGAERSTAPALSLG